MARRKGSGRRAMPGSVPERLASHERRGTQLGSRVGSQVVVGPALRWAVGRQVTPANVNGGNEGERGWGRAPVGAPGCASDLHLDPNYWGQRAIAGGSSSSRP